MNDFYWIISQEMISISDGLCKLGFIKCQLKLIKVILIRGGVEDTWLEAKAKDTKKSEAKGKDSLSEGRPSPGQGQECSRPRPRTKDTGASVLQNKTKKNNNKIFNFFFQAIYKISTIQKIMLSSS